MRKVASESIVLLHNEGDHLAFLTRKSSRKVAIVGSNAQAIILSGVRGSAALKPQLFFHQPSRWDGERT